MPVFSKRELTEQLSKVDGFLRSHEAYLLHSIAKQLPANATAAEIGSWMGRSSVAIALPLVEKNGKLHTIDDHSGITDAKGFTPREYLVGQFEKNIRDSGVASVIEHHPKSSDDLAPEWNTQVDFLFIDGDHRYCAVVNDIKHYAHFVKKGGWIAFHDSGNPEVSKAIAEWANKERITPAKVAFAGTILAIKIPAAGEARFSEAETNLLWSNFRYAACLVPKGLNVFKKWRIKYLQSRARRYLRRWSKEVAHDLRH